MAILNTMFSSQGIQTSSAGSTTTLYIDKDDDNYGIGENLTFHVDAENNIAIGASALNSTGGDADENIGIGTDALRQLTYGDKNTAVGYHAGFVHTTGSNNTIMGADAFSDTNLGTDSNLSSNNVAIGISSMGGTWADAQTDNCVAIGSLSLSGVLDNVDGTVAIGASALGALTSGTANVAMGYKAGYAVTEAAGNTVIGYEALMTDTGSGGGRNTALGYRALKVFEYAAASGYNTAIGWSSLLVSTSGIENTCVGASTAVAIETGDGNVMVGSGAGSSTVDVDNTVIIGKAAAQGIMTSAADGTIAIGVSALTALTSGAGNTAIGYQALAEHTTGSRNIAIGANAMNGTAGDADDAPASTDNVFIGYDAGGGDWEDDEDSNFNVGIGNYVMDAAMDGALNNTAVGHLALSILTGGDFNTIFGGNAGGGITTGSNNVMIGYSAGNHNVATADGIKNVIIGSYADTSATDSNEQIAIGYDCQGVGDNTATLGIGANTASIELNGSNTSWAAASSDERLKENIESSSAGLSFVNDLRPVVYNWKKEKDVQEELPYYKEGSEEPVLGKEYGETLHGFIAQEVKEAIDKHSDIKEGFKMWKLKDDGIQTVADGNLMPIMVKAIQELSAEVEKLKNK